MALQFDDAVVLITGASSGIGQECALQLAPRVKTLILVARRKKRLEALKQNLIEKYSSLRVDVVCCDLADIEATRKMTEELQIIHPHLDILINNAGIGDIGFFHKADWKKIQSMLCVNMIGLSFLSHWALSGMVLRKKGGILNISSGFGLTWMPFFSTYVGSKHYVTAFSESLRVELVGMGVTITQACPGPVKTEFEEVADSPFAVELPGWMYISAAHCARSVLRGFEKGRALVIPGFWAKVGIWSGRITPRWVMRIVLGLASRLMQKKSQE